MRLVIRFLNARNVRLAEIYRQKFWLWCGCSERRECEEMVSVVQRRQNYVWPHAVSPTCALLEQFTWEIFEHPPYISELFLNLKTYLAGHILRDKSRCVGLSESLSGDLFRRRRTKAGPKTWLVPYFHGDCGVVVHCRYQHVLISVRVC
jgi:hypothetical protein